MNLGLEPFFERTAKLEDEFAQQLQEALPEHGFTPLQMEILVSLLKQAFMTGKICRLREIKEVLNDN